MEVGGRRFYIVFRRRQTGSFAQTKPFSHTVKMAQIEQPSHGEQLRTSKINLLPLPSCLLPETKKSSCPVLWDGSFSALPPSLRGTSSAPLVRAVRGATPAIPHRPLRGGSQPRFPASHRPAVLCPNAPLSFPILAVWRYDSTATGKMQGKIQRDRRTHRRQNRKTLQTLRQIIFCPFLILPALKKLHSFRAMLLLLFRYSPPAATNSILSRIFIPDASRFNVLMDGL